MNQVITIHPDGLASGLQRKRGQGLDLRTLGAVMITRVSLVEWDEGWQQWIVRFIAGPRWGEKLTYKSSAEAGVIPDRCFHHQAYFDDYDDAVRAEVAVLDRDRLGGIL